MQNFRRLDWSSQEGAQLLAVQIKAYWLNRGYPTIMTWIEKSQAATALDRGSNFYVIRSNLVRGFPPIQAAVAA